MRNLLLAVMLCFFVLGLNAQDQNGKPVVYIEYFTSPDNLDETFVEALRNKVIEGIQATNRVELRDVASQAELRKEAERRKEESAMADETARMSEMRTLGANFIITGDISMMDATKRIDDKGKVSYKGTVRWSIKVIDASDGTLRTTRNFDHSGITGKTAESSKKAILKTCDYAEVSMSDFVDDTFPIEGMVLKVETLNKKKTKAQTVYIDLGSVCGIVVGQKFSVFLETDIAGEIARTEIGSLNAEEVLSANRTLCKVTKGGDAVLKAVNDGQKLIVVSRKARTFLDKLL